MRVNERDYPWRAGLTLAALRDAVKPDADVVVLDGFPVPPEALADTPAGPEADVTLIRRGEGLSPSEAARLMHARHTPGVAGRLAGCAAGVAGLGGLGSHAALALARTGVGRLVLADADVVEPSNLNRQAYAVADLGRPKAEALAGAIRGAAPAVAVEAHRVRVCAANAPALFSGCGVVLECFDDPAAKRMLVETLLGALPEVFVVAASGLAGLGDANRIRARLVRDRFALVGDGESAARPGRGLMAPRVLVASGHQANVAIRFLLGEDPCPDSS